MLTVILTFNMLTPVLGSAKLYIREVF